MHNEPQENYSKIFSQNRKLSQVDLTVHGAVGQGSGDDTQRRTKNDRLTARFSEGREDKPDGCDTICRQYSQSISLNDSNQELRQCWRLDGAKRVCRRHKSHTRRREGTTAGTKSGEEAMLLSNCCEGTCII